MQAATGRAARGCRHARAGVAVVGGGSGATAACRRCPCLVAQSSQAACLPGGGGSSSSSRTSSSSSGSRRPGRRRLHVAASWPALPLGKRAAEPRRLFVFGLGYTGLGAATYFQQRGWEVAGTCRTPEKREALQARGITTFHFDPADYETLGGRAVEALRHATHVLSTVPPDANEDEQDPVILAHSQQLAEHADAYQWVGYVSSTSVYGDYEGEWVDECSELRAAGGKGWSRVLAEHEWLALHDSFGLPVHIFRCGGIYGPRRSALEAVQRGAGGGSWRPSASQERRGRQRFTARCHVLDICRVLEASTQRPRPGAAYNVADDDPAERATVLQYAAALLEARAAGAPLGSWAAGGSASGDGWGWGDADASGAAFSSAGAGLGRGAVGVSSLSSAASSSGSYDSADEPPGGAAWRTLGSAARLRSRRERGGAAAPARVEEKRVRNALIKRELGVQLLFPSYREGLGAIAAGDLRPFE